MLSLLIITFSMTSALKMGQNMPKVAHFQCVCLKEYY